MRSFVGCTLHLTCKPLKSIQYTCSPFQARTTQFNAIHPLPHLPWIGFELQVLIIDLINVKNRNEQPLGISCGPVRDFTLFIRFIDQILVCKSTNIHHRPAFIYSCVRAGIQQYHSSSGGFSHCRKAAV